MEDGREYHYAIHSRRTYVVDEAWATAELPVIRMGELIEAVERPASESGSRSLPARASPAASWTTAVSSRTASGTASTARS